MLEGGVGVISIFVEVVEELVDCVCVIIAQSVMGSGRGRVITNHLYLGGGINIELEQATEEALISQTNHDDEVEGLA